MANIQVSDIAFLSEGADILIRRSKTDQTGKGATVSILNGRSQCPVRALKNWISAAGITEGAVFRGVYKSGTVRSTAMTDKAIYNVVKAYAERAGFDPKDFEAHSLRSGFLTSAAEKGQALVRCRPLAGTRQ